MGKNYIFAAPGGAARMVKVVGYARKGYEHRFLCQDVRKDGTVPMGPNARSEWVSPWFKPANVSLVDWNKYSRMQLQLKVAATAEG